MVITTNKWYNFLNITTIAVHFNKAYCAHLCIYVRDTKNTDVAT